MLNAAEIRAAQQKVPHEFYQILHSFMSLPLDSPLSMLLKHVRGLGLAC